MKVSTLISHLEKEIEEVRKQNVGLRNANEIYSKQNIDLRKNQDQDDLNRQITELKKENTDLRKKQDQQLTNRQITILRNKQKQLEKDNFYLKGRVKNLSESIKEESAENVRLVAQLENDEHNVGHLDEMRLIDKINFIIDLEKQHGNSWKWIKEADKKTVNELFEYWTQEENPFEEKMKRLDYLEKHVAENRYVFTEIPNTPENLKMVKLMKKHINKRKYTMRWRGQYLIDGQDWRKYTDGQPLSKSKCIRVYIDSKAYSVDTVEGFNEQEVGVILDGLHKKAEVSEEFIRSFEIEGEENGDVDDEKRILDVTNQLYSYFESMKLHLENSASTPIKDNVNIVIPKGEKNCHTQ